MFQFGIQNAEFGISVSAYADDLKIFYMNHTGRKIIFRPVFAVFRRNFH